MSGIDWQFTFVLLINGVLIGLMYSLIALGFVLIYKATDAINFAQGEFVMFAGFIAAAAGDLAGLPFWAAALLAIIGMVALGFGLERVVLRPLIGRPIISVIMATIGLAAVLRGTAVLAFGAGTRAINMPIGDTPIVLGPVYLPPVQLVGAGVSLVFLAGFSWFFLKSRIGVAMRAVADNQQVAMAMGINVQRYFGLAWAMAGVVSALGGIVWGAMLGVDNQLALVGLKVFPVVILGGLELDPRRGRRRARDRHYREHGGRLSRPLCRRRHQGFCAVCVDDRGADDPPRGHVRPPPHRARVMSCFRLSSPHAVANAHSSPPRKRGSRSNQNRLYQLPEKIAPGRIHLLDEHDFPAPSPSFDAFFSQDGFLHCCVKLGIDEAVDAVPPCKPFEQIFLVFGNPAAEVARDPNVERTVSASCENVDAGTHCVITMPRLRRPWTPAFAGVTRKEGAGRARNVPVQTGSSRRTRVRRAARRPEAP